MRLKLSFIISNPSTISFLAYNNFVKSNIECKSYVLTKQKSLKKKLHQTCTFAFLGISLNQPNMNEVQFYVKTAICKFLHLWKISSNQFSNKIYVCKSQNFAYTHIVEKWKIYSHPKNISSNQLFSNFFSKTVTITKILPKLRESKFP